MKHRKTLKPRRKTEKKMEPLSRDVFIGILNKAIKTPSEKPATK